MEKKKEYKWYKISGSVEELRFSLEGLLEIEVNGKMLCLNTHNDQLFACTARCPHAGGRLAEGFLDAKGDIVCPLHRYKFSTKNGRNTSGEGYFLKTFPVEIRNEGVFVGFEDNSLFNWLK